MPVVRLGHSDGKVTTAHVPDGDTPDERFRAIADITGPTGGVWNNHKGHSGTDKPSWVWSDDSDLQEALAGHYGCDAGEPGPIDGSQFGIDQTNEGESDQS